MQVFNFHTHNQNEEFGIINAGLSSNFDNKKNYSIGIHPWNYSLNWEKGFNQISESASNTFVVAIGETGFDPKSKVSIDLQRTIFEKHVALSEKLQKPLIIHCVKYFNEIIEIKNRINPHQAWIIHGYRGKLTILKDLIEHDFYFSINEDLLKDTAKAEETFQLIGPEKLFLETDDKNADIRNIYNFAAKVFNIKIEELLNIISQNLSKCKI